MSRLLRDLLFGIRQLRKSPGFTFTVLLTLALCIGANTAIFSVVDAVFFRSLPYPDPGRLVMVVRHESKGGASGDDTGQTGRQWELIRDHATYLDSAVFPGGSGGVNLVAHDHVEYVKQQRVSANFFHVLGVPPLLGRSFTTQEDVEGGPNLTVLSYDLWQHVFGGDLKIVGQTVRLRGAPFTAVGVMPAGFRTDAPTDLWTPVHASHSGEGEGENFQIVGRLKPGVTLAAASGQLTSVTKSLFDTRKLPKDLTVEERAVPMSEGLGTDLRPKVRIMWAAVALVLLIGCVNIAGLLLSRSAVRSREIATRLAIGASRARIVGQLLVESLLLALGGGVLGILFGQYALKGLVALNPDEFGSWADIHLDSHVLGIMLLISLGTSILFGLFPAWEATSVDLRSALADSSRSSTGARHKWRRQALVFAEVALGVMLVIGAGLLVRTFAKLASQKPGYNADHVLTASLSLQDARYSTTEAGVRLFKTSLDRIEQIPGVESAAVALTLPYQRPLNTSVKSVTGENLSGIQRITDMTYVTPGFFPTLQIPLLRGRLLSDSDTAHSANVAVVNEAFLRMYFRSNHEPLGSSIKIGDTPWQVVGIVGDVPQKNGWGSIWGPIEPFAQVYVSAEQFPSDSFSLVSTWFSPNWIVRTHGNVPGLPDAMRRALQSVDPTLPFSSFASMKEIRSVGLAEQRYQAVLFSAFAILAVLLAALGVYGLIAQSVTQRTREMGIRMALGASVQNVVRAAVAPGLALSLAGVATGLLLGLFAARVLKSMIWGVSTSDPLTLTAVALLLLLVGGLSSLIPALRLTTLDPARTLRDE
ncbi:MAG: ABC transporter permease [Acidobacteriota bacterium]|nr:ABC transporter permease [Acidobacteriota bacterium]